MDRCARSIGSSQFKAAGNWNRQTLAIRFRPAAICHQRQNSDSGKIARFFFRKSVFDWAAREQHRRLDLFAVEEKSTNAQLLSKLACTVRGKV